ncbi:hypothetical protein [Tumebacillus lipolyticus]|uniref:Uncharacterized protein n=1 Tax=Tumebacillus lipolyticus TaxID=1280370 RepID=A0ABW5A4T6_9BACL
MKKQTSVELKTLNDATRIRIQAQKAQREYNQRRGIIEMIMTQNKCDVLRAIEVYSSRKGVSLTDAERCDLQEIREELSGDATV